MYPTLGFKSISMIFLSLVKPGGTQIWINLGKPFGKPDIAGGGWTLIGVFICVPHVVLRMSHAWGICALGFVMLMKHTNSVLNEWHYSFRKVTYENLITPFTFHILHVLSLILASMILISVLLELGHEVLIRSKSRGRFIRPRTNIYLCCSCIHSKKQW